MARVLTFLSLGCVTACTAVLGVDFEGRLHGPPDASADGSPSGACCFGDGDSAMDDAGGSASDDATAGDYLAEKEALAALRVRIADAPASLDAYFASRSWVHWVDAAGWHSLDPIEGTKRNVAVQITTANDDFGVHRNAPPGMVSIYSATSGSLQGSFNADTAVAVDGSLLVFDDDGPNVGIRQWRSTAPSTLTDAGTVATVGALPLGKYRNTVYLRDSSSSGSFFAVDVDPFAVRTVDVTVVPQAVARVDDALVVTHVVGAEYRYQLVTASGPPVDLTQRIDAVASDIPKELRVPFQSPATLGEWIIFSAKAGILAFRPRDEKLVPLQLRAVSDSIFFDGLHVVETAKTLVFTIAVTQLQGLYYLKLDALLPK